MTDNEIIKALECCLKGCNEEGCDDCPLYEKVEDCEIEIPIIALDLINRQKAEIEQLKFINLALSQNRIIMPERLEIVNNARDKAIREFAERLKSNYTIFNIPSMVSLDMIFCDINRLLKEMTEGNNGNNP